jgi:hypothetical protein
MKRGCKSAGESAAFTIGDQNVCAGTRQTLANKPYPDHVIYGELHNQMKGGERPDRPYMYSVAGDVRGLCFLLRQYHNKWHLY